MKLQHTPHREIGIRTFAAAPVSPGVFSSFYSAFRSPSIPRLRSHFAKSPLRSAGYCRSTAWKTSLKHLERHDQGFARPNPDCRPSQPDTYLFPLLVREDSSTFSAAKTRQKLYKLDADCPSLISTRRPKGACLRGSTTSRRFLGPFHGTLGPPIDPNSYSIHLLEAVSGSMHHDLVPLHTVFIIHF